MISSARGPVSMSNSPRILTRTTRSDRSVSTVNGSMGAQTLRRVIAQSPMFYSETLPKSPASAGRARELITRVRNEVPVAVFDDARLLVSELVANAVEHVPEEGDIEVRVELGDGVLRIEVLDPGTGFEYVPRSEGNERGWGLHFATRAASAWGKDVAERARVWVELRTR